MDRRRFLHAASAASAAGIGVAARPSWAFHDEFQETGLLQPSYGEISNLRVLGYTDLGFGSAPDGSALDPATRLPWDRVAEFRVIGGYAYCSNYQGWSIVDVREPRDMKVVFRYQNQPAPDNTQYIDIKGGNILVQKTNFALKIWDVTNKTAPTLLSLFTPPDIRPTGAPFHGLWIHEDRRGRFAMAAVALQGYTDMILIIVDITNPRQPREVSRWHYPGMHTASGETPTWPSTGFTVQAHDITTYLDRAYVAWRDKGVIILDISNIANPTRIGEINWSDERAGFPPLPGQTHSVGIVVPNDPRRRPETIIVPDELGQCPYGFMHLIDIRNERRPIEISGFRLPLNMHGNCPADRPGRRFGAHDLERMIHGNIVWSAWEEGGFWGFDISDLHYPREAAYFIPPVRSDSPSTSRSGHADDVFVARNGIIFGSSSDPGAGGLWAMRHVPGLKGRVVWNTEENGVIFLRDR